jgi:hypothetical protein
VALVKIQDYAASNVIVIPMTSLQTDETGKYVFVLTNENGKAVAKKKCNRGFSVRRKIEIRQGITGRRSAISEGFRVCMMGSRSRHHSTNFLEMKENICKKPTRPEVNHIKLIL